MDARKGVLKNVEYRTPFGKKYVYFLTVLTILNIVGPKVAKRDMHTVVHLSKNSRSNFIRIKINKVIDKL